MHTTMKRLLLARTAMATVFLFTAAGLGDTPALWAEEPVSEPTPTVEPAPADDQGIQDRGLSTRKPSFQNRSQGILPGPSPTPANPAVTGTPTYNLAEVLKRPDTDVLTGLDGKPITVGEVKRRATAALAPPRDKAMRQTAAGPQRIVARPPRPATVNGQTIPPDAAFSTVDPRLVAQLQALPDEVLIRQMHEEVTTRGLAGGPSLSTKPGAPLNNQDLTRPPLASKDPQLNKDVPCGRFVARLPEQRRRYFLSAVNGHGGNFGINLEERKNVLLLSGCFGPTPPLVGPAAVQIYMPPLGSQHYLPAQIKAWTEKLIVAELPLNTTGIDDGEIAVRVVVADGSSTNSRYGLFRAHRQTTLLPADRIQFIQGPCMKRFLVRRDRPGPGWITVGEFDGYDQPTWTLYLGEFFNSFPCTERSGREVFGGIGPFRESVDVTLLDVGQVGSHRISFLAPDRLAADWAVEEVTFNEYSFGIKTGSYWYAYLAFQFAIELTGPAGVDPYKPVIPSDYSQ